MGIYQVARDINDMNENERISQYTHIPRMCALECQNVCSPSFDANFTKLSLQWCSRGLIYMSMCVYVRVYIFACESLGHLKCMVCNAHRVINIGVCVPVHVVRLAVHCA
jgi:hypothetical protein